MVTTAPNPGTLPSERFAEPFRFSREDYDAMIATGILDENDHVELIDGKILTKRSIGPTHTATVKRLNRIFAAIAGEPFLVSVQDPIALDDFSEPEPDLALLKPNPNFYSNSHPTAGDVYLVVEVADSSLRFDRERKIPLYAAAGIPEVWLINLVERCLIRHRNPQHRTYSEISRHVAGENIPIPGSPQAQLVLADLAL